MWSAECERDGPSVSMIAWSDSDSVAFGISSAVTCKDRAVTRSAVHYHAVPCSTVQYRAVPCITVQYRVQYRALPCAVPCSTVYY